MTLEEAIRRWVVITMQPFTAIEEPEFKNMIRVAGSTLPILSADTLRRRLLVDFEASRNDIILDLKSTCTTISLSLDAWTSTNNLAILGVIGHWITPDFKYREYVLEFCELQGM